MQRVIFFPIALLVIMITVSCGCSRRSTLADRFRPADRVIVVDPADASSTMPLTAEQGQNLIRALSNARKESPLIEASVQLRIQFFKGTNFLGALLASETGVFGIDGAAYSDSSGVLQTIAAKFTQEQAARKRTREPAR